MDYKLSDACEPPQQPRLEADDRKHPKYSQYLRYRAAMSAQLVQAPKFRDWLAREEEAEARSWED